MSTNVITNPESDVHITQDNQKKINTFAVRNAWLEELEQELKTKENDLKNLEDAEAEVVLMTDPVPITVGDSFVHFEPEAAAEELTKRIGRCKDEIQRITSEISSVKSEMNKLKADLYERFGDNINLENEES